MTTLSKEEARDDADAGEAGSATARGVVIWRGRADEMEGVDENARPVKDEDARGTKAGETMMVGVLVWCGWRLAKRSGGDDGYKGVLWAMGTELKRYPSSREGRGCAGAGDDALLWQCT